MSSRRTSTETDHFDWDHEEGNNIDLDDGNSLTCSACLLPIFLTPFTRDPNNKDVLMHDECPGEFPPKLKGHVLHPKGDLILLRQHPSTPLDARLSCARCGSTCGTIFYKCLDDDSNCNFRLDLKCAQPIRVLHRSHRHRLTIKRRRGCSFTCYACGCVHERPTRDEWVLCYECVDCDFQIHQDCAVLPNAIVVQHHRHPLLLQYYYREYYYRNCVCYICESLMFNEYYKRERESYECEYYECLDCWFGAHINCAIEPFQHKSVLIRNAQVPNLLHLPMENEYSSVMASIMKTRNTNDDGGASNCDGDDNTTNIDDSKSSVFEKSSLHKHGLILLDADGIDRVCNACIQIISPLDQYCTCIYNYNGDHNNNKKNSETSDNMSLSLKLNTSPINTFECYICFRPSNGPLYYMDDRPVADVVCANMPNSITHDAHARTHILYITHLEDLPKKCNCCGKGVSIGLYYKCHSCRNFFIHPYCALLPNRVRHKFDRHPLKLVTTTKKDGHHETGEDEQQMLLCEICEMDIDKRFWYYSCTQCDHSFHISCIPYVDHLSKIKLGFTVRVGCHDCPVASVRALSVHGYRCGDCGVHIKESDETAFECANCYFRIHKKCVEKYLSRE